MKEKQGQKLFGSISYVMVIMILSRVLSLISTQVYMAHFGVTGDYISIYSYAISIPNILFNCFGTALSTVVIPLYAGYVSKGDRIGSKRFADNIITVAFVFTAVLAVIGLAVSPLLPHFTAFKDSPETYAFCVKALMIMMPVMIFYGLNYIFQGMLQSEGIFGWPAFVSVPSSLVVILYVFLLSDRFGVTGLLVATFIGLALQALILVPPLIRTGYRYKPSFHLKDPDIITVGKMTLPVLIGASSYQLNMFYNVNMIANFEGMVTLLTYVQNLVLYMVLAFIYSITAVLYPKLTVSAANDRMDEYRSTLNTVFNSVILLLLPITFGLVSVRTQLMELLAKWGKITDSDIRTAGILIAMYAIGILGIGLKEILDRAFYALKITKISAINGFFIMLVNISLSLILIRFIGPYGIPLAYSVASLSGALVLILMLRKKAGNFLDSTFPVFLKALIASVIMFFAVSLLNRLIGRAIGGDSFVSRIVKLLIPAGGGAVLYGILLYILRVQIVVDIVKKLLQKLKGRTEI